LLFNFYFKLCPIFSSIFFLHFFFFFACLFTW
jgi:hypothetical protein